jgi:ketosteroid isomerase-like protein
MSDERALDPTAKIAIEQLLRQMNDAWGKALVRRDAETLEQIMADDFFFAYPMEGDDKSQLIGDIVGGNIRVEYLNRENVTVRIWGDTAVVTGKDSARWYYQGRDFSGHYKIIQIYSHRNGRWQLCSVQSCPID